MKRSAYLSTGLLLAVVIWMLSGAIASVPEPAAQKSVQPVPVPRMKVEVMDTTARDIDREIVIQGELEPLRQVELRAETTSRVSDLPVTKGERVESGALLIQLAKKDRAAQVARARAEVDSQKLEVAAARRLTQKGLQAENRLKAAEAALAAARAELKRATLELGHTRIEAPFAGILEQRHVELGSHVEASEKVALLVDESILKAVGQVSQQSAGELRLGQAVTLRLLDGREAKGRLTYISRLGDAQTHSFRVEAQVANPEGRFNAGSSVELRIAVSRNPAHFLSPAVLSLGSQGEVGVKSVDDRGLVHFHPIDLVRTEADGVWVSGLPERLRVITQGQGFVKHGETVTPVPASRG